MKKNKLFILVGLFVFIALVGGISYSYFVYNKEVADVSIDTGEISINLSNINGRLNLANAIPKTDVEGMSGSDYIDFIVTTTVDTEIVYYEVYVLPKSGNTMDTSHLKLYLTDQNNTKIEDVSIYDDLANSVIGNGKAIYQTLVMPNNDNTTKTETSNMRLRLWIDENYSDLNAKIFDFDIYLYAKNVDGSVFPGAATLSLNPASGTVATSTTITSTINTNGNGVLSCTPTDSSVATCSITGNTLTIAGVSLGSTTITVNEAAGILYATPSSTTYSVTVESNPNSYAANIKCQRVTDTTKLHTETCSQTSNYCVGDGYTGDNTLITYGNAKALNTQLAVGDAFDCDVNGDGIINKDGNGQSTERFYYVSDYLDTSTTYSTGTTTFDNTYATLIYYKNFVNGSPSDSGAAYATKGDIQAINSNATSYDNWHGPVTAVKQLPTTSIWSNITLKTTVRAILAEDGSTHNATSTSGGTLPAAFSYSGKAARLLTGQELIQGCGISGVGSYTEGELSNCKFLFEETKYANPSKAIDVLWLETPHVSYSVSVWVVDAYYRFVSFDDSNSSYVGVRPTIDVPYSQILY